MLILLVQAVYFENHYLREKKRKCRCGNRNRKTGSLGLQGELKALYHIRYI